MNKYFICLFLLLYGYSLQLSAQDLNPLWETHFSFYNVNNIESEGEYIYASSKNSIFIYNYQTNELTKLTTKEGLSGEFISSIYFSENKNKLVIGFDNGLIQVKDFNSNNVYSIYDIIDKTTISPDEKRINNFNEYSNDIYISTDYGISVFNLDTLEFGDTFFIGTNGSNLKIAEVSITEEYIYAACKDFGGIRKALRNSSLIDFNNWSELVPGSYSSILSVDNSTYFSDNNNLYNLNSAGASVIFNSIDVIKDFRYIPISDNFVMTTNNNSFIFDIDFNIVSNISSIDFQTNFNSTLINSGGLYIATSDIGVIEINISNPNNYISIYPEGASAPAASPQYRGWKRSGANMLKLFVKDAPRKLQRKSMLRVEFGRKLEPK